MIDIYVLEDNVNQQFRIEKMIGDLLETNQWEARRFDLFSEPDCLTNLVEESFPQIFFLDIDIHGDNTKGIEVAKAIREKSRTATIVFVTTHSEFMLLTYRAQVSALDFIDKTDKDDAIKDNLKKCLQKVFEDQGLNIPKEIFVFENNKTKIRIPMEDILYFETAESHRLKLITKTGQRHFYGSIKEVMQANQKLFRCHKSYLINLNNIVRLDKKEGLVYFDDDKACYVSRKYIKDLRSKMENLK
ncbi:LytR/AlgR family response regulator transcription factor [Streptococcus equinus]|uniref:LytR/AlgR family response regulator transcription factor n=1 Tax=Streptococcus equinus TaxID=1335 RepID=UPI00087FCEC6|nr:LytTR family DNA-binding domain-containing protein [Streptococcus equinus]SDQ35355.1 two component transcriptional regulator, LytTR family [Streptococcus equinus]